ncbi:MAG: aminotransferase class V-fold PLP-dependent enzyme [Candidatus Paceibacterota bacterium]
MRKIISISLSPNTEKDDVFLAMRLIFQPWKWKQGPITEILEKIFQEKMGLGQCFSFNSGRSCLLAAFSAMGIGEGDEIIAQSFTCNAVINPILKFKAKPVYVDIGPNLNMDLNKIEEKITPKTKAIIAQHTFGWPAEIEEIKKICEKHKLILIEDCAHALGAKRNGKFCGSFGDISFFSFGRDKIISSVYGGMLCANNKELASKVSDFYHQINYPKNSWIIQQILHPILTNLLILPFYGIIIGKIFMAFFVNLNILSKSVTKNENQGILPEYFPYRLPNALASMALNQFEKLDKFNTHRRKIAMFYNKELEAEPDYKIVFSNLENNDYPIYLKYPLLTKNSKNIMEKMKKNNIYLNDGWRDSAIMPPMTNLEKMIYLAGSCSLSESIVKEIIYLPTHINISLAQAKKIVDLLKTENIVKIKE